MDTFSQETFSYSPPKQNPTSFINRIPAKHFGVLKSLFLNREPIKCIVLNLDMKPITCPSGNIMMINTTGQILGLNLADNHLEHLPDTISQLDQLCFLNLTHNRLIELPESFCKLTHLRAVNLSYNRFVEYPPQLNYFPDLHYLELVGNPFITLPWPHYFIAQNFHFPKENPQFFEIESVPFIKMKLVRNYPIEDNAFIRYFDQLLPLQNDSLDIWNRISLQIHERNNLFDLNFLILRILMRELSDRYFKGFTLLTEKIAHDIALDPLDYSHPRLGEWYNLLEKFCLQHPNKASENFLQFLRQKFQIQLGEYPILL